MAAASRRIASRTTTAATRAPYKTVVSTRARRCSARRQDSRGASMLSWAARRATKTRIIVVAAGQVAATFMSTASASMPPGVPAKDAYDRCVPDDCASWFDGCNTCSVGKSGLGCTLMACETPGPPRCLDEKTVYTALGGRGRLVGGAHLVCVRGTSAGVSRELSLGRLGDVQGTPAARAGELDSPCFTAKAPSERSAQS